MVVCCICLSNVQAIITYGFAQQLKRYLLWSFYVTVATVRRLYCLS